MNKVCNKCGVTKRYSDFEKDLRNKDGLQGICSVCRKNHKKNMRLQRIAGSNLSLTSFKTCNKCNIKKSSQDFFRDAGISDGRSTICKTCKTENTVLWREKNREYYNKCHRIYHKKHYQRFRMLRYKITPEHHDKMLLDQKGVCAICGCLPKGKRPLAIDHDHNTGKVRGLLCYGCNRALHILESTELLDKAKRYLETHA